MAEEIENGASAENNGGAQNETAAQVNETASQQEVDFVNPLEGLESMISQETLAAMKAGEKKQAPPADNKNNQQAEQKKPEGDAADNTGSENNPDGEKKPEVKNTGDQEKKSVFGIGNKKKDTGKQVVIETPDHIIDAVKKFGVEVKDIKDLPKFFEVTQKWREDSQKLGTVQKEAENFKQILEGLPAEFIQSIQAYYKGEDYAKPLLSKPKFDFSKPTDQQDVKSLVNHYFPNEFTDDDFNEETPSKTLEIAKKASIDKFEIEKQRYSERLSREQENATKRLEAIKSSVNGSVNSLKQDFPDADEDTISEIQSILEGGPEKLIEFFFNNDRTAKQDAAKKLMLAAHGESEIKRMMDVSAHVAETRTNEEILTRGADKPSTVKRSAPDQIPAELRKQIDEIKGTTKKTTF